MRSLYLDSLDATKISPFNWKTRVKTPGRFDSLISGNEKGDLMVRLKTLLIGAIASALVGIFPGTAHASDDGVDAWRLYDHKAVVSLGELLKMWECWADMEGSDPELLQRVGKRWVRLDIATVTRDESKCGSEQPIKAVYEFKVRDSLRWNKKKKSYEATVRTTCSTCVTYNWTILVDK